MKKLFFKAKRVILVCLFPFIGVFAVHAETLNLDIQTAVDMALQNNLNLQSERIDLRTRERVKSSSWNEYLPSMSIDATSSYINEAEALSQLFPDTSQWYISAGIRASLDLTGTKKYSIREALLEYESGKISLEEVEKGLIREIQKSFYYLILLQEGIEILNQNIDTAQKRYDQAKLNYESGLVSELTMLNTLVTLENLKPELEGAQVMYRTAELQFRQLLGLRENLDLKLIGIIDIEEISLESGHLIDSYASGSLSVQSMEKTIQLLENQKKLVKAAGFAPVLSVSSSLTTSVRDPLHTNLVNAAEWLDGFTFRVGLSFPLDSLIPSSKSKVSVQEIDDSIAMAHLELTDTLQRVAVDIETSVLNLQKSLKSMASLEQNVVLAQKVYDLTELEYNAGVTDLLRLEDANDQLLESKLAVLTEKYNYLSYLFDLEYTLNTSVVTAL